MASSILDIFEVIADNPSSICLVLGFILLFTSPVFGISGPIFGVLLMAVGVVLNIMWLGRR